MPVSHALSEKAIKKLGLDKELENSKSVERVSVKEWDSSEAYWNEWMEQLEERHAKWYDKIKCFFEYRILWCTRDWWCDMKWYFHNLKTFQPILKSWRSFSYTYQIDLFKFGMKQLADAMTDYGAEAEKPRERRIEAIHALIKEIERDYEQELTERMNYSPHSKKQKVTKYSDGSVSFESFPTEEEEKRTEEYYEALPKERKAHYQRIFDLIIGQDNEWISQEIERRIAAMSEEEKKSIPEKELRHKVYYEVWDGSGIEGWWD